MPLPTAQRLKFSAQRQRIFHPLQCHSPSGGGTALAVGTWDTKVIYSKQLLASASGSKGEMAKHLTSHMRCTKIGIQRKAPFGMAKKPTIVRENARVTPMSSMSRVVPTTSPADSPEATLASIAARAAGGRVAVLERGTNQPKIVRRQDVAKKDKPESAEVETNPGDEVAPAIPILQAGPGGQPGQQIDISPDAANDIREVIGMMSRLEGQVGALTLRYNADLDVLKGQHADASKNFQSVVSLVARRHKVPQGWVLNLDKMAFVPAPQQQQPR